MNWWLGTSVLLSLTVLDLHAQNNEGSSKAFSQAIEDNSFFLEEAYNQEERVVQHISSALLSFAPQKELLYSFTQEWPIGGREHQLSFSVPYSMLNPDGQGHLGDVLVNYRLQLFDDDAWSAVAPRVSIILPTGNVSSGMSAGVVGMQFNLPASKRLSEEFVAHVNAGATLLPRARQVLDDGTEARNNLTALNLGASLIWLAHPDFNVMLEYVTNFTREANGDGSTTPTTQMILSPGFRCAINVGSLQVVPGIGIPMTMERGVTRTGVFLYLSFEHPY
jgi:hypothetical protein